MTAASLLGLPWTKVKQVAKGSDTWHPGNDNLAGNYTHGTPGTGTWSINFSGMEFTHFLFAHLAEDGESPREEGPWLICTKETARESEGRDETVDREVLYSSEYLYTHMVGWEPHEALRPVKPWISTIDFGRHNKIVFGEGSWGIDQGYLHLQRGAGVWIINNLEAQLVTSVTRTVSDQ